MDTLTPEALENIRAILTHPVETDDDYAALAELVEDESDEMIQIPENALVNREKAQEVGLSSIFQLVMR